MNQLEQLNQDKKDKVLNEINKIFDEINNVLPVGEVEQSSEVEKFLGTYENVEKRLANLMYKLDELERFESESGYIS